MAHFAADLEQKLKDEDEYSMPFQGLKKGAVIQNVRMFSSPKINTRECYFLLTKILYILNAKGEDFTQDEATKVFIAVTKLFQSQDVGLRRMMYLLLKELGPKAEETIMAFASLVKDVNSSQPTNKANSIRVISGLMDSKLLSQAMERYMKQAIVDKDTYVASAALVSSSHLASHSMDIIKRWTTELQEALNSHTPMVQYHALGLLHRIKAKDRLAVVKLIKSLSKGGLRSPFGHCLLIRFTTQVLEESAEIDPDLFIYLESCLHHKSEMVVYEACRSICHGLTRATEKEVRGACAVLQVLLGSGKVTSRFAAVKTLNKVATRMPHAITSSCAYDMESLIGDVNRSVATLAITTLLKVETENNVDRLMKQISSFIGDVSEEDKLVVVEGVSSLSVKYPNKHFTILQYLSNMLRSEGGKDYKAAIVDAILGIVKKVPESKELGLEQLCEFIEDCEYPILATKILNLIGTEGPRTSTPSKYIRYIYNRIALENETVRASAVSALAKFGLRHAALRPKIVTVLKRSLYDTDDEVRDRATFYHRLLSREEVQEEAQQVMTDRLNYPLINLENDLRQYLGNLPAQSEDNIPAPFDVQQVSKVVSRKDMIEAASVGSSATAAKGAGAERLSASPSIAGRGRQEASIPELEEYNLGNKLASTRTVEVTESEAAFPVSVQKHLYPQHLVLQYSIANTLEGSFLKNVKVMIKTKNPAFVVSHVTTLPSLAYSESGHVYAVISRPNVPQLEFTALPSTSFLSNLVYAMLEVDSKGDVEENDDVEEEETQLDELTFGISDYFLRAKPPGAFLDSWTHLGDSGQAVVTFSLSTVSSIPQGVQEMIKLLGMAPCEDTETVEPGKTKHILYLAGKFTDAPSLGGVSVLARVRMMVTPQRTVGMELTVRSMNQTLSNTLANSVFA